MSALLRLEAPATDEATYVAVLKGAPEVVKGLLGACCAFRFLALGVSWCRFA